MKNLTKIFMAVVAGMFAFSCVTDTIEDPTIEVGKSATTEITVSLEESKTQLGDKDAAGKYPLYWSTGDAIAVNGVASLPLSESFEGKVSAAFNFEGEVSRPFSAVYPAPAEGVTAAEGLYPVTFLATQEYTEGTFAAGAAPMYGYAAAAAEGEAELPLQLNHLTGVLRFAIKGEKTLSSIVITAEQPIAGNFDVDCQTGALTAHEDASKSVTVTFGEGLALGAEATPIYVAVPAGEHGLYTITINSTEEESMVVKFNSDYHPVKVGVVKEFGEILFVPNATTAPEGELIITNEADMKKLGLWAENGMLSAVTSVKVAGNIDMSKISNWHPIVNFPAITFDGGSEQGYEIKNLTTPLFEVVTDATIQNVKLTGVNITETERLFSGSLVCEAYTSTVTNCSLEGAYTYAYAYDLDANEGHTIQAAGGLVGLAKDTNVSGCTNYATVLGSQFWAKCGGKRFPTLGGVIGTATASAAPESKEAAYCIKNCQNFGTVTSAHNTSTRGGTLGLEMGGVLGRAYYVYVNNIVNGEQGTDKGAVTITAYANSPYWGGCVGWLLSCYADGLTNYAPVSFNCKLAWSCMGGVIGTMGTSSASWSLAENLYNYGTLTAGSKADCSGLITLGGVIGRSQSTKWTVKNAYNYGDITANGKFAGVTSECYIGGVFAECNVKAASNCYSYGDVKMLAASVKSALYVGGVAGVVPSKTTTIALDGFETRKAEGASANPVVEVTAENTTTTYVGGVIGAVVPTNATTVKNFKNAANVTLSGASNVGLYVGGVVGQGNTSAFEGCVNGDENSAPITIKAVSAESNTAGAYVGGITGNMTGASFKNCSNHANVELSGTVVTAPYLGGIAGYAKNTNMAIEGLQNYNNTDTDSDHIAVNLNGLTTPVVVNVGGLFGYLDGSKTMKDCTNNCSIDVNATSNAISGNAFIGGIGGKVACSGTLTNCHNGAKGDITVDGLYHSNTPVSGIATSLTCGTNNCSNAGDILGLFTIQNLASDSTSKGGTAYINGMYYTGGGDSKAHTDFTNSGNLTFAGTIISTTDSKNVYMSGVGYNMGSALTRVKNTGTLKVSKEAVVDNEVQIGGIARDLKASTVTDCSNSGTIISEAKAAITSLGGLAVVSTAAPTIASFTNTGDIVFAGNVTGNARIGGLIGEATIAMAFATDGYAKNEGKVTNYLVENGVTKVGKSKTLYVGGVWGRTSSKPQTVAVENTGFVDVRNAEGAYTDSAYIGGIAGNTTQKISNAKVDCDIAAIGFVESSTAPIVGVGMITGIHRGTSAMVNACKIGGRYALVENAWITISPELFVDVDAGGDPIPAEGFAPFWTKIYGGNWDKAAVNNCEGCTYESANPAVNPAAL